MKQFTVRNGQIGVSCSKQSRCIDMAGFDKALLASILALLLVAAVSMAQEGAESAPESLHDMTPEQRRAAFEAMTEAEKQAARQKQRAAREKRRAEWQAMTPEERQAAREEMRARIEAMTPEQREAMRERRQRNQNRNKQSRPEAERKKDRNRVKLLAAKNVSRGQPA